MGHDRDDARIDPRAQVRLPAAIFGADPDHPEIEATTRNLSAGGALCECAVPLPLGRPIKLRLDLPDDSGASHAVILEALVLRVEAGTPCVIALHFINAPARILELVKRFVFRRDGGSIS